MPAPLQCIMMKNIFFVKTPLSSDNFKLKYLQKFKILDKDYKGMDFKQTVLHGV